MAIRKPIANNTGTLSELPDGDGLGVDYLALDLQAAIVTDAGELAWSESEGTVAIGLNGGTAEYYAGQQTIYRVINQSGSLISKGTLCMYDGTIGASGKLKVVPWNGTSPALLIMGMALADIPTENEPTDTGLGYVVAFGKVRGLNTTGSTYSESWANGDILYAGPSGGLTKTKPTAPSTKSVIAAVVFAHPSVGELLVRVGLSSNLGDDDLVELSTLANGQVLSYDTNKFVNKTLADAGIYSTTNPAGYTTNTGTVTSVDLTAGTGISVSGGPVTSSGSITVTNTAPDQTVVLTGGTGITTSGTYPNFTIDADNNGTVTSVSGTGTVNGISLSGTVTSSGDLTLGGTLTVQAGDIDSQTATDGYVLTADGAGGAAWEAASGGSMVYPGAGIAVSTGTAWDTSLTAPSGTIVGTTDTQTLTNKTITDLVFDGEYTEEVFTISDGASVDLDPSNGTVQLWTLGASRTPTATNFAAGQSITLMVDDGTDYTITWPSVTWVNNGGSAPTLATSGYTVVALWKVSTTLYGALVGDGS